ncbi:MAG: type IV secretion system DNA-binding domain-containing protein [Clostridia bacterium]|nr:type IV secretion system DNA-binding domain-containing protein [Clostridia bacterium]
MNTNHRQDSTVLFGDRLLSRPDLSVVHNPTCCLQGEADNTTFLIPLDEATLSKHILLLGGIGTGKTNTFFQVISQLEEKMTPSDVMIVFDTKGDFYKEFYTFGDVVISNDDMATGAGKVDYWNIFAELDNDEHLIENVVEISKAIFAEACEKTSQVFFPNAARDIFMALMVHMVRSLPKDKCTNKNLVTLINGTTTQDLRTILNNYDEFRAMTSYISIDDSPQTQGVLSELQQITREVFIGNFAKHGDLGIRSLVRAKKGKKIFIEYDLGLGGMLSPVYSLIFDLAIKEALSRNRSEGNVYFITDEFKLLPHLTHIDDAVNFGRSLGIKFMIGIQNVEQIYENYGEQRARSIMSGFLTNISFRVNDACSREYIQGLYGKNQKLESYLPKIQKNGMVETLREANVIEDWDITNLQVGEAIVGLPGSEPFKFKFEKYEEK